MVVFHATHWLLLPLQAGVAAPPLPAVTVVLPVRGCRSHSVANWEAILNLDYGKGDQNSL